jgi:hypothetical protein
MSTLVAQTISNGTVSTSSANVIQGSARAWVNFNGTLSTPITPRSSYNVTNITKNATGDYTVNFTNALPNTNYSVAGMGQFDQTPAASSPALVSIYRSSTALAQSSCRILTTNSNSTSTVDFPTVCFSAFSS